MHRAIPQQNQATPKASSPKGAVQLDTKMVSDEEAADILKQKKRTLAIWRTTGRYGLPYVKIGRRVFYRVSDLEAFIERRVRNGHKDAEGDGK